jgi:hypothetical protein
VKVCGQHTPVMYSLRIRDSANVEWRCEDCRVRIQNQEDLRNSLVLLVIAAVGAYVLHWAGVI